MKTWQAAFGAKKGGRSRCRGKAGCLQPPQPLAVPGGHWPRLQAGSCVSKGAGGRLGMRLELSWVPSVVCAGGAHSPWGAARCLPIVGRKGPTTTSLVAPKPL